MTQMVFYINNEESCADGMRVIVWVYYDLSKWHDYDFIVLIMKLEEIRDDTKGIMIN